VPAVLEHHCYRVEHSPYREQAPIRSAEGSEFNDPYSKIADQAKAMRHSSLDKCLKRPKLFL